MPVAGIGRSGRRELTDVLGRGKRFVTPAIASEALGVDPRTAAKKLAHWTDQGWLRRVRRGLYVGVPVDAADPGSWSEDPLVVANEVWPCYFTGWTAANHWALTDQVFRATVLKTTARVRSSTERLLDHDYLLTSVRPEDMTWGLRTQWQADTRLRFADPARTVVEILDTPRLAGGMRHGAEVLAAYLDEHEPMKLIEYGDKLRNHALFKRLGYALDAQGQETSDLHRACRDRVSAGISALDPDGPKGGRVAARWNLRINVTIGTEEPA